MSVNTAPLNVRIAKSLFWFIAAAAAFYFIAVQGNENVIERSLWPTAKAKVLDSQIKWTEHMTDEYRLTVKLEVQQEEGLPFIAYVSQAGPKGALEKRRGVGGVFAKDSWLKVHLVPGQYGQVVMAYPPTWGPWILGGIVSLLILSNGFVTLRK